MPYVVSLDKPIQEFTRKGLTFKNGSRNSRQLSNEEFRIYLFRADGRTKTNADASPVGLGAVLTQQH